jgi:formylmethanofuran--tetrahydromethanopterin N-formyltransferase
MMIDGVFIEDTFAEAFPMIGTRLVITADTQRWADTAAASMTGFATSVIACGCEAAVERALPPEETPDGRPGVAVLIFSMSPEELQKQLVTRVGQCVLTTAGTACFSGLSDGRPMKLGAALRYFGDGFQIAKSIGGKRYWRMPVMDGEFLCEDRTGSADSVGGGNFLIIARSREAAREAAERAVAAMRAVPNAVMPFPGGVVRSGSKIGGKYRGMIASTNDAYCPTLKAQTMTALPAGAEAVLEIVIDGFSAGDVAASMRAGMRAACSVGATGGIVAITAGNYGGKLGPFHFHLRQILQ